MMLFRSFLAMLLCTTVLGQNNPTQTPQSRIEHVTLFLSGALIHETATISLPMGRTEVILNNLSPYLNDQSLQVTVEGDATLLSVSSRVKVELPIQSERLQSVHQAIDSIQLKTELLQSELSSYDAELSVLSKNESIGGQQTGVAFEQLRQTTAFYFNRHKEIAQNKIIIQHRLQKMNEQIGLLQNRYQTTLQEFQKPRKEAIILLQAPKTTNVKISLRYLVNNAQWQPTYNIRATDLDQPIALEYQANVYNNTGIDWEDVRLTISTGNPTEDASIPTLEPWRLNYNDDDGQGEGSTLDKYRLQSDEESQDKMLPGKPKPKVDSDGKYEERLGNNQIISEVPQLNAEFVIAQPYTIPANATPYLVAVNTHQLEASYRYFVVPKVKQQVFLLAEITGWEDLNLIAGKANIYYGSSYLGNAFIDTHNMRDTLRLSLGTDNKVVATRVKVADKSNKKLLNLQYRENLAYKIEVKNTRKIPIQIEIWDQVPVAQEKDIQVSVEETSKAQYEEMSGKLVWQFQLQPNEVQSFNIGFEIKYPRHKRIKVRNTRSFHTPRYF